MARIQLFHHEPKEIHGGIHNEDQNERSDIVDAKQSGDQNNHD
ncbi:hypothetical protein SDC9_185662 [bioreactor metagenome]|uniref:Uncharacterized protein n=1 Tax=bioreactor metagenome TaxID=1076179 RepID=A0A645HGG7_9ZZZZ